MKRRDKIGILDLSDNEFNDNDDIRYCPHCEQYGFKQKLEPRIYAANEPVPSDSDLWKMCWSCGSLYALHQLSKEPQIKNAVETISSPFESGSEFLAIDSRKLRNKKRKKQNDEFDYIADNELKNELKKGSILLSYSEEMPQ